MRATHAMNVYCRNLMDAFKQRNERHWAVKAWRMCTGRGLKHTCSWAHFKMTLFTHYLEVHFSFFTLLHIPIALKEIISISFFLRIHNSLCFFPENPKFLKYHSKDSYSKATNLNLQFCVFLPKNYKSIKRFLFLIRIHLAVSSRINRTCEKRFKDWALTVWRARIHANSHAHIHTL